MSEFFETLLYNQTYKFLCLISEMPMQQQSTFSQVSLELSWLSKGSHQGTCIFAILDNF